MIKDTKIGTVSSFLNLSQLCFSFWLYDLYFVLLGHNEMWTVITFTGTEQDMKLRISRLQACPL